MSHDRLLAASGQQGPHADFRRLAVSDWAGRYPVDEHAVTCDLAPELESVRTSRKFTRNALRHWGMGEAADVAELVVCELVTNALRHGLLSAQRLPGEHPIGLRLLRQDPNLMCLVTDPGSDVPVRREPGACAESGRGLQVVESCCLRWGWQLLDGCGKVVWALLQVRELPLQVSELPAPGSSACPRSLLRRAGRRSRHPWRPG